MVQLRRSLRVRRRSEQSNASNTSDVDPTEDRKELLASLQPLVEEIKEEEGETSKVDDVWKQEDDVNEQDDDVTQQDDDVTQQDDDVTQQEDDVTQQNDDVITQEDDVIELKEVLDDDVIEIDDDEVIDVSSDDDIVSDEFMDKVMDNASKQDGKKLKLRFVAGDIDETSVHPTNTEASNEVVASEKEETRKDENNDDEISNDKLTDMVGSSEEDDVSESAVTDAESESEGTREDETVVSQEENDDSDEEEEEGESSDDDESSEEDQVETNAAEKTIDYSKKDEDDEEMDAIADDILSQLGILTTNNKPDTQQKDANGCSFGEGIVKVKDPDEKRSLSTAIQSNLNLEDTYVTVDESSIGQRKILDLYSSLTDDNNSIFKHSVIQADFATRESVPQEKTKKQLQKERIKERKQTLGKKWYHMRPPEMTDEVKRDLEVLQMRNVLDPKRFYKHNDRKTLPKYFQMGTIMDSSADYYSSRLTKKQRKQTLVDELLADAEFKNFQKRKYSEIQAKQRATGHFRNRKRKKV